MHNDFLSAAVLFRSNAIEGTDMKLTRIVTASMLLLAAISSTAHAQVQKTREQVQAELREAIRTGDVIAAGDAGLKLNELNPQRYPHAAAVQTKTRAQVQAELAEAIRDGSMVAAGEAGTTLRDEFPQRYPQLAVAPSRTREEVIAETREAIHNGDMYPAGEAAEKLNDQAAQRYAGRRGLYTAQVQSATSATRGAAR